MLLYLDKVDKKDILNQQLILLFKYTRLYTTIRTGFGWFLAEALWILEDHIVSEDKNRNKKKVRILKSLILLRLLKLREKNWQIKNKLN